MRLHTVLSYGGIYLDRDVFLHRKLNHYRWKYDTVLQNRKHDDVIIVVLRALVRASAAAEFPPCLAGVCESSA